MSDHGKILVVDDDPHTLALTSAVLASGGYDVIEASTGKDALEAVAKAHPDLVVLDVVLPDMSGFEVCKQIKADPDVRHTFVALQSGLSTSSQAQTTGLDIGADGYIVKGIPNNELLARVNSLVRIKKAEDALQRAHDELDQRVKERTAELLAANQRLVASEKALLERLRFERLLSDLSAELMNISPDRLDSEIERGLKQILDFFKVDRCGLIRILPGKGTWRITHAALSKDTPPVPVGVDLPTSTHPWVYHKLVEKGELVSVSRRDDLPPEANVDKQTWIRLGIWSTLSIPFSIEKSVVHVITINAVKSEVIWPEELFPRLRLLGEIFVNALVRKQMRLEIEERLRFERLISALSARFVGLAPEQIDGEIQRGQCHICELLDLDRSALFELSEEEPRAMMLWSSYQSEGSPPAPERLSAMDFFSWVVQKALSGETVTIEKMSDLPPEAARDRESWRLYGTKSTVVVPLSTGGGPVFGGLTFVSIREERDWPETVVKGFQLIAQVFSNALARKRADGEIRKYVKEIENLKQRLEDENIYLQMEIELLAEHTEIVGRSLAIKKVLSQAERVAPTGSTVLMQGETGTGKELLARAIHRLSSRKDRPLVTVNCASLPPTAPMTPGCGQPALLVRPGATDRAEAPPRPRWWKLPAVAVNSRTFATNAFIVDCIVCLM